MATAALGKTSRMDLRMEDDRKAAYEEAARLKGQSLSQWSLANLDAAAARDIEEARIMRLPRDRFDELCRLLDEPMPGSFRELLEWDPQWA
ncbi:MAG: DUF1778 domain-containing protein [Eggerthellaceae bacterium]|nr:DUF1778 domain-containing protein [Eggerthellaceae bacterium]